MVMIVLYSIGVLLGLFAAIYAVGRFRVARDARGRKRAFLSLVGSIIIVAIFITSIYLCIYKNSPPLAVAVVSGIALILNHLALGRYSKPEGKATE